MKVQEMKATKISFWTTKATMKKITTRNARFAHGGTTVGSVNEIIYRWSHKDFICPMCKKRKKKKKNELQKKIRNLFSSFYIFGIIFVPNLV